MDAIALLTTRRSAHTLNEPGPSAAQLEKMLAAAARVPDHGKLRPWRFLVVRGTAREALGAIWADSLRRRQPGLMDEIYAREAQKALRAPILIVVACKADPKHPKIPEIEQVLSAGSACYALTLAAQAQGFGAMWKTGAAAYDANVKLALGLSATDHITGFVHIGTDPDTEDRVKRPDARTLTSEWTGPAG